MIIEYFYEKDSCNWVEQNAKNQEERPKIQSESFLNIAKYFCKQKSSHIKNKCIFINIGLNWRRKLFPEYLLRNRP